MLKSFHTKWRQLVFLEHKPETGEVFLKQRRVFTLPSKAGWMFILLLLILFLSSTNYSLSLGFALTFVLTAVAVVNAFLGFRNLAYLHLLAGPAQPVFAGEDTRYTLFLINRKSHQRYALWVGFTEKGAISKALDIAPMSQTSVELSYPTNKRGMQAIPRVKIETWFPLGLLRAWSTWLPDSQALIYPRPEENAPPLPISGIVSNDVQGHAGDEDFAGVRAYQAGDQLKHLAWKQIARIDLLAGGQLVTKQFTGGSGSDVVLDFSKLPKYMDQEDKLSRMTSWVIEAERLAIPYGFRLGSTEYLASNGPAHQEACLRALALFEGGSR